MDTQRLYSGEQGALRPVYPLKLLAEGLSCLMLPWQDLGADELGRMWGSGNDTTLLDIQSS